MDRLLTLTKTGSYRLMHCNGCGDTIYAPITQAYATWCQRARRFFREHKEHR